MKTIVHHLDMIPLTLPVRDILSRLEYSRHRTRIEPGQRSEIDRIIAEGFALCQARGVYREIALNELRESCTGVDELLKPCDTILLMASTVGMTLCDAAKKAMDSGSLMRAVILDAVGSECADEAMNFVQKQATRDFARSGALVTARRFSPGYGHWALRNQRMFFEQLELNTIGMTLDDSFTMKPEKSVTALAGIIRKTGV